VISSVLLGALGLAGVMGAFGLKLNFVNFVVLPITFGIGADYAVNLYVRHRQGSDLTRALGATGGAIAVCSATTIIGYAALILADNRAVHSFGLTAVIGEMACLAAALVALPPALRVLGRGARGDAAHPPSGPAAPLDGLEASRSPTGEPDRTPAEGPPAT
jgi:uncharacterized protein